MFMLFVKKMVKKIWLYLYTFSDFKLVKIKDRQNLAGEFGEGAK